MSKRDLERVILPSGAALEEELALLGCDQQLGGLARAARVFDDRLEHADVEVRHDDRQLIDGKAFALAAACCRSSATRTHESRNRRPDPDFYFFDALTTPA